MSFDVLTNQDNKICDQEINKPLTNISDPNSNNCSNQSSSNPSLDDAIDSSRTNLNIENYSQHIFEAIADSIRKFDCVCSQVQQSQIELRNQLNNFKEGWFC